eukprot:GEMP01097427.1.p1 GENE.GEMP01097427.1~~GEMP01097427.1.p1  ORF type:complete len:111 (-),score=0.81 GEMP01097427.1:40-372(-)
MIKHNKTNRFVILLLHFNKIALFFACAFNQKLAKTRKYDPDKLKRKKNPSDHSRRKIGSLSHDPTQPHPGPIPRPLGAGNNRFCYVSFSQQKKRTSHRAIYYEKITQQKN